MRTIRIQPDDDEIGRHPRVPEGFWVCAAILAQPVLLLSVLAWCLS